MRRERWLDDSRAIACLLVVIGHLFMSLREANIVHNGVGLDFFIETIYHFHVYIFFFCSGFLFQKSFVQYKSRKEIWGKKVRRVLDMLIPYVLFSFITYSSKILFSGHVNTIIEDGFINTLCNNPINQMWFLYALVLVDLVTPAIKNDRMMYLLAAIGIVIKLVTIILPFRLVTPLAYLCSNEVWFVIGMIWAYKNVEIKRHVFIWGSGVFFSIGSVYSYQFGNNKILEALLTLTGVIVVVEMVRVITKKNHFKSIILEYLAKYMFQIYLLHTMCAAFIRIVLIKMGYTNGIIHIIFGLVFSFFIPIICAWIFEKSVYLNIAIYPTKTIDKIRKRICVQEIL